MCAELEPGAVDACWSNSVKIAVIYNKSELVKLT